VTFRRHAEQHAHAAVDAILTAFSDTIRRELEALRAEFEGRLAALQPTVAEADRVALINQLVEQLAGAAAGDAEEAARHARHETEEAGNLKLEIAQSVAHAELERERADHAALRQAFEEFQQQAHATAEEAHAKNIELAAAVSAAQEEAATAWNELQDRTARLEMAEQRVASTASAQAEFEARSVELTAAAGQAHAMAEEAHARAEEVHARNVELSAAVSSTQEEAAAARAELQDAVARLEMAEQRLRAAEEARSRVQEALEASEARLADEARERTKLLQALEAVRESAVAAQAETGAYQTEVGILRTRVQTMQTGIQRSSAASLARVRRALRQFAGLTRTRDVIETFVEQFGREFDRGALFAVRGNALEEWRRCGADETTEVRNLVIPLAIESPLTQAVSEATSVMVETSAEGAKNGLLGRGTHCAVAVPIFAKERVVAVAYAEWTRELPVENRVVSLRIVEIFADQLTQAFAAAGRRSLISSSQGSKEEALQHEGAADPNRPAPPPVPSYPGPPRAADRVRAQEELQVLVDGGSAQLVDISRIGAQVLCTKAIRPNHRVRVVLPRNGEAVHCQGRVVWALFEMVPEGGRYRAGLQFVNVDTEAVDTYINEQILQGQRTTVQEEGQARA
jgi:hypothetical protein